VSHERKTETPYGDASSSKSTTTTIDH
jgi:hypothetical protein